MPPKRPIIQGELDYDIDEQFYGEPITVSDPYEKDSLFDNPEDNLEEMDEDFEEEDDD